MADAVLGVLLENLVIIIKDQAHYAGGFPDELNKLKDELQVMQSYLKDMDQVKKDRKETLKMIIRQLKDLLYDAEDQIADCELMLIKQQRQRASNCMKCFSPFFLISHHQMGKKLCVINQKIGSLTTRMGTYLPTSLPLLSQEHVTRESQQVRYPILIDNSKIVGLNDESGKIMEWILQGNGPLTVVGIIGMGGVGKTTLAQKIYNDATHFNHKLIVVISQSFDLKEIIKVMLTKLGVREFEIDEMGLLQQLYNHLDGNYLLILDDIWTTFERGSSWWESLMTALPQRNDGSCVIFTSRKDEVAQSMGVMETRIHRPKLLSDDESWSLFSKIAFANNGNQCPNQELEHIGKKIVAQCGGLALAIKVVGGMMIGKGLSLIKWKEVSDNLEEELRIQKKDELVFPVLRLSYEDLPMHLKACMLCFAAFPEDFEVNIFDMIYWWIGEGFIQGRDEKTKFEIGEEWWAELVGRGLLLGAEKEEFERCFDSCRVHDMVRDMIIKIVKEEKFMDLDDGGNRTLDIQSRRVSIMNITIENLFSSEVISKLSRMRTLFGKNIDKCDFISKLCHLKWLRVLTIEFQNGIAEEKDEWWIGIGSLLHLICLRIRNSKSERLLDSIGKLQNLQAIFLDRCQHLKRMPAQLTSLQKLTNINIAGCDSLEYYPAGFGNLSNLQQLLWFNPARSRVTNGCRLSELRSLTKLERFAMTLDSEERIGEKELQVLSQLEQLKILWITFSLEIQQFLRKVNYDFSPCHRLQKLYLFSFPGIETPVWVNPITLPNLHFLYINGGQMRRMHSNFFEKSSGGETGVWKLEVLSLIHLYEMEEEWPRVQRAMPYLRLLKVSFCSKLKNFPCDVNYQGRYEVDPLRRVG